ncbi:MAG: L,D-transpeptidase, partial [Anaerolineales bacterium]
HGTYWHQNYGRKMSHGCVNMTPEQAKWLYRWAFPEAPEEIWEQKGFGTTVWVT